MKNEFEKFLESLTLQTPISEVKEYCTGEEKTLIVMNKIYNLVSSQPCGELSENLQFTFAGEKVQKDQTSYINIEDWKKILDGYHSAKDEKAKLKAFQKIIQVVEGDFKIIGGIETLLTEQEKQLAKVLFSNVPKEQLKTSLIQRKMKVGYGKASKIKDFLLSDEP